MVERPYSTGEIRAALRRLQQMVDGTVSVVIADNGKAYDWIYDKSFVSIFVVGLSHSQQRFEAPTFKEALDKAFAWAETAAKPGDAFAIIGIEP